MRPNARNGMHPFKYRVILVSLLSVLVPYLASQNVADVVKQSSDAVVLIVISNSAGQETALGSGFLISAGGEIVTNYHVIKDAHSAIVKLSNGAFFRVDGVLASDADKDLAIIKVSGKNLPFLTLGNIDHLHVGDHVVAIGSPLGLEGTVSDGIVSAVRDVAKMRWIQTTAPVSHGNSGGPLLDMNDHVVGVITWGVNLELGQNLNFAAPSSEVKTLLVTAQQAKPLDSVVHKGEGTFAEGAVWTSITNGHDYGIRQDGEYLYIDWVHIPPDVKTAGGFERDELRKSSDGKWRGTSHQCLPCTFDAAGWRQASQIVTKLCNRDLDMVINLMSDKRIEGINSGTEKFDCYRCEAKGAVKNNPFTWIPK
jgi:S1-C subfamily serine protease